LIVSLKLTDRNQYPPQNAPYNNQGLPAGSHPVQQQGRNGYGDNRYGSYDAYGRQPQPIDIDQPDVEIHESAPEREKYDHVDYDDWEREYTDVGDRHRHYAEVKGLHRKDDQEDDWQQDRPGSYYQNGYPTDPRDRGNVPPPPPPPPSSQVGADYDRVPPPPPVQHTYNRDPNKDFQPYDAQDPYENYDQYDDYREREFTASSSTGSSSYPSSSGSSGIARGSDSTGAGFGPAAGEQDFTSGLNDVVEGTMEDLSDGSSGSGQVSTIEF
jgi:hypothetical protein